MSFDIVTRAFENTRSYAVEKPMTLNGTLTKIGVLLTAMILSAVGSWFIVFSQPAILKTLIISSSIIGFVLGLITVFRPHIVSYTALPYAICQGLALGVISLLSELAYPGIVTIAVSLTAATAIGMLILYRTGLIQVTETFKAIIASATFGIAVTYGIVLLLSLFGFNTASFFSSSSIYSILFSVFVTAIAAFNLLLDFARIEEGVEDELPKFMEWYGAFSVLVTLIWLYLEILRLLRKIGDKK